MQGRLRPAGGTGLPCRDGRSMGTPGSFGTLRPPGVWYIACHKGMRTLFRGAAAGADGRGHGRAMADPRTATSPAGNGATILEALQIQ